MALTHPYWTTYPGTNQSPGSVTDRQKVYFRKRGGHPSFGTKALLGVVAGIAGGFAGVPADVVMVRMTLDGRLPPDQRRNYKNGLHALYRVTREEGLTGLFAVGVTPILMPESKMQNRCRVHKQPCFVQY